MRSKNRPDGQGSFIEQARRRQIVEAAVEVLAEAGFAGASLARIAERAGISKGVISYHFGGKEDLMVQLVEQVYGEIGEAVFAEVTREETPTGMIRRYPMAVAAHMRDRRDHIAALGEVFNNLRDANGKPRFGHHTSDEMYRGLETLYRAGQQAGVFRDFDTRVMAVTQQAAIDAMFGYWVTFPEHDLEAHARELADLFDHATRATEET